MENKTRKIKQKSGEMDKNVKWERREKLKERNNFSSPLKKLELLIQGTHRGDSYQLTESSYPRRCCDFYKDVHYILGLQVSDMLLGDTGSTHQNRKK